MTPGNFAQLNYTASLHKRERQTNHHLVGSVTKTRSRWVHKFGAEHRALLSNYNDSGSAFSVQTSADYTRQTVTATGGAVGSPTADVAGYSAAAFLMGAGTISISAGRNALPALAQKYFGLYTQNDWRATNRLTIFLGLRWDLQPGPTERYNHLSAFDLDGKNPYGSSGAYVFPGIGGNSRNLWDTHYRDFGPRLGFGYKLLNRYVVRGGYGVSYLPTNTGHYDGPDNYGMDTFTDYTASDVYGPNPAAVLIGKFNQVNRVVQGTGTDATFPTLYGGSQKPRFDRHGYVNGRSQQWNVVVEGRFGRDWQISAGYSGSKGSHLPFASFPLNHNQAIPQEVLQSWRADYMARNGRGYAGSDLVSNPWQPASGALIPFKDSLGRATMQLQETLQPWPMFGSLAVQRAFGFSRYDALQLTVNRRFSNGLQFNAHYTWSKSTDFTQTNAQNNNGFNDTGSNSLSGNVDYRNLSNNKKLSFTDLPHRFVATYVYQLPFGKGGRGILSYLTRDWRTGGAFTWQAGFPIQITGADTGALTGRPDRISGVPVEVPKELQHWYDGKTRVQLPSGRFITPCNQCFLKYSSDAFQGRVVTAANGSAIADLFWEGTSALTYGDFRGNGRVNWNTSLRRSFRLTEKAAMEFSAESTNTLNHTQFRPTITGALGATNVTRGGTNQSDPGTGAKRHLRNVWRQHVRAAPGGVRVEGSLLNVTAGGRTMRSICAAMLVVCAAVAGGQTPKPVEGGFFLPNGWRLTPVGRHVALDDYVLNLLPTPDGKHVVALNCGYNPHGLPWWIRNPWRSARKSD